MKKLTIDEIAEFYNVPKSKLLETMPAITFDMDKVRKANKKLAKEFRKEFLKLHKTNKATEPRP